MRSTLINNDSLEIRTFVRLKTAILDTEPLARAILQPEATTVKVEANMKTLQEALK